MATIMAVCGLDCWKCEAYIATQAGDEAGKQQIADKWAKEYGGSPDVNYVSCDGCLATSGRLCGHCYECGVRLCAVQKGYSTCAECPDFVCETLNGLLQYIPEARARLETLRTG